MLPGLVTAMALTPLGQAVVGPVHQEVGPSGSQAIRKSGHQEVRTVGHPTKCIKGRGETRVPFYLGMVVLVSSLSVWVGRELGRAERSARKGPRTDARRAAVQALSGRGGLAGDDGAR